MADLMTIPEQTPTTMALIPATDAAGRTSSYFSLKNCAKAYAVFYLTQGNAATITCDVLQATNVSGGSSKAIAGTCRIWATQDIATAATAMPARQTDAASFTTSAALTNKVVVIEIDPAVNLDVANGFDCIALRTGASNVANLTAGSITFVAPRFVQRNFPTPRVD